MELTKREFRTILRLQKVHTRGWRRYLVYGLMVALPILMLLLCALDVSEARESLVRSGLSLEDVFLPSDTTLSRFECMERQLIATDLFLKALLIAVDVCGLVFMAALAAEFFFVDVPTERLLVKLYGRLYAAGLVAGTEPQTSEIKAMANDSRT